jgi:hypothetical protein
MIPSLVRSTPNNGVGRDACPAEALCGIIAPMMSLTLLALSLLAQEPAPAHLDAQEFTALHASIVPRDEEAWQTIPWQIDLLAARTLAASSKKPLFIWSMNGHPLGCT